MVIIVYDEWNLAIVGRQQLGPIRILSDSLVDLLYQRFFDALSVASDLSDAGSQRHHIVISIGSIIVELVFFWVINQS